MLRIICGSALAFVAAVALHAMSPSSGMAADKPDEDAVKKELEKFQGTWTCASYEREGRKLAAEMAKDIKYEFKEDKYTLKGGIGFSGNEGMHKIDPTKKIKEIDITPGEGRNKGKTFQGIYEWDGGKLKICAAAPGEPRPTEFDTPAASKRVLYVLEKEKK